MLNEAEALMLLDAELGQSPEIDRAMTAEGADHAVAQSQQVLGEIRAVLAGNSRNQCRLHTLILPTRLPVDSLHASSRGALGGVLDPVKLGVDTIARQQLRVRA